ncbi:MAG: chemotaxis protein CheA [Spirochaetales bacterium]|nr:chemotaxis protein CheA [Spirochaetales bacterium]
MNDKLIETFLDEAHELLDGLEEQLLELEKNPADTAAMNGAFRALHSIKGSASMFGFDDVGKFAHEVEAALDHFRSESLPSTPELADAVLRSRDLIRTMLDNPEEAANEERDSLVATLSALAGKLMEPAPSSKPRSIRPQAAVPSATENKTFWIRYRPSADAYRRGIKPESLIKEVKSLGKTSVRCDCERVPPLSAIDPEACYLSWDILLTTEQDAGAIRDIFIFEEGSSEVVVEDIDYDDIIEGDEVRRLGEILAVRNLSADSIKAALSRQRPIGEILVEDLGAPRQAIEDALFEQKHARTIVQSSREDNERKTIRIRSDKLDALLNLVGELVTVQAQLSQTVKDSGDRHLHGISDYVKRLAGELRSTSMELRLVPVDSLFAKFKRLIRDLSKSLGKELELRLEGGDTEIDKSVIDVLNDPLVHLVRNAADHGLESPEARQAAGKPAAGTITLKAQHAGAFVRISVMDDGAGLNRDKILKRAVDRGIVQADVQLEDREIDQLIFKPGFSTADVISSVSGRGVGLDVVKTAIDQLGGHLNINSTPGQGTEFSMDIPLTLAIIDGFLVRSGTRNFVIPLSSVDSCFERERPANPERLIVRGKEFIPYVSARDLFGEDEAPPEREEIVIVSIFESRVALGFDQVLGGYQTVIKPIGEIARYAAGVSGAAILADGGIALILDVAALARQS